MRNIPAEKIKNTVAGLCLKANFVLRKDVLAALRFVYKKEKSGRAKEILKAIIDNAAVARREKLAICQDTGVPCVFVDLGQDAHISGDLKSAIQRGIEDGYRKGCLRNSIVKDPLKRARPLFKPAIVHIDIVKGNKIRITVMPKGFGCENKSQLKMFKPTASIDEIKRFIIDAVKSAGADACPPFVVGVGIGGTADYAGLLAKKALLRKLIAHGSQLTGLEKQLFKGINKLNIGPMGLGGATTALAVRIETHPTHIAGLPVAVNISCHALRSATATI